MHPMRYFVALCAAGVCLLGNALAQTRPATGDPEDKPQQYLGSYFISKAAGIALRPPIGGTQVKPAVVGTNIVQFINSDEKWILKLQQVVFERPAPMLGKEIPAAPAFDPSKPKGGVLPETTEQLLLQNAGSRLLRQDVISVARRNTGMIAIRYTQASQVYLRQVALIQRTDQHYYIIDLTSPSSRAPADREDAEDPSEAMAVKIFGAVLDSVQLLDLRLIEADIEARLYAARSLMVTMATRVKQAIIPEQYFRLLRDGKDIGWSFVTEEPGPRLGEDGVFVSIISQAAGEGGAKVNLSSEMFSSESRRNEAWVTVTTIDRAGKKQETSEIGQSDWRVTRKLDPTQAPDPKDHNPAIRVLERYLLNVTQTNAAGAKPITRELPARYSYLPQAFAQLLPRLVSLNEPKGYLFLVWVSNERELVHRYIDVEGERNVTFGGAQIRAAVVKDRLGLEGEPTFHYFTAQGRYLGSQTPSNGISIIATDLKTISRLYPSANLARPRLLDAPGTRLEK